MSLSLSVLFSPLQPLSLCVSLCFSVFLFFDPHHAHTHTQTHTHTHTHTLACSLSLSLSLCLASAPSKEKPLVNLRGINPGGGLVRHCAASLLALADDY
jgi:hypothetical protein